MKKNKIKILITGVGGLIGGEFYSQLKSKKISVKGIDINNNILSKKFLYFLKSFKPNIIIHCASHPGGLSFKEPIKNIQVNYIGSVKIIKWCAMNNCKFIFLSSSAVYGNRLKKIKIKENDQLKPETIYGINKLAVEKFIESYSKYKKFDWLIFRLFATYGPGHKPNNYQGIINVIISQLKYKNNLIIKGSLSRTRSLIYVKDAVKLMLNILLKKINRRIINIAGEKYNTVGSLVKCIKKIYNKNFQTQIVKGTPGDPLHNIANVNLMKKLTKMKINYDIYQGINEIKNNRK